MSPRLPPERGCRRFACDDNVVPGARLTSLVMSELLDRADPAVRAVSIRMPTAAGACSVTSFPAVVDPGRRVASVFRRQAHR